MKRDLDLIRQILLNVEDEKYNNIPDGYTQEQYAYHVDQLIQQGFLRGNVTPLNVNGRQVPWAAYIKSMTPAGHDFIDTVRSDKVWEKTKSALEKSGGSGPLDVIQGFAAKVLAELIKSSMGG